MGAGPGAAGRVLPERNRTTLDVRLWDTQT